MKKEDSIRRLHEDELSSKMKHTDKTVELM